VWCLIKKKLASVTEVSAKKNFIIIRVI